MSKIADQLENRTMIGANVTKALMRTQEWIQTNKQTTKKDQSVTHWSMDKHAPGVLRKKKQKTKNKKKKKNSNNNAQSKFNERHVRNASHKRCQVANSQCTRIGTLCKSKDCLVIYVRSLTTGRDSYYRLPRNGMRLFCFLPVLQGCKP